MVDQPRSRTSVDQAPGPFTRISQPSSAICYVFDYITHNTRGMPMAHMNQHFTKTNVLNYKGEILQWKKTTALAQMHKLGMEYGVLKAGQCDNHERGDVKEAASRKFKETNAK